MKFHIFGLWEKIAKPLIYTLIFIFTFAIILLFFKIDRDNKIYDTYIFIAPVIYALFLFISGILLEKLKKAVEDKLNERKSYFSTIIFLRKIVAASVNTIDASNYSDIDSKVKMFQVFTGRDKATIEALSQKKPEPHPYVKENGFIYKAKMLKLETKVLEYVSDENNAKKHKRNKYIHKLTKLYNLNSDKLEKNYIKLNKIYGSKLKQLVENESIYSNIDSKANNVIEKTDKVLGQIEELSNSNESIEQEIETIHEDIKGFYNEIAERLDEIESSSIKD